MTLDQCHVRSRGWGVRLGGARARPRSEIVAIAALVEAKRAETCTPPISARWASVPLGHCTLAPGCTGAAASKIGLLEVIGASILVGALALSLGRWRGAALWEPSRLQAW